MGNRRMAEIKTRDGSLYVYTHSGGHEFAKRAQDAVKAAAPRLGDDSYVMHILVDQLMKPGRDRETDYGLMLAPYAEDEYNDGEPSIVINLITNELVLHEQGHSETVLFAEIIRA